MNKLKTTLDSIKPIDKSLMEPTQRRLDNLTKPLGSLGKLEEFTKRIVSITGEESPKFTKRIILTMAGDHGVTDEGVSAYPQAVTEQMVYNFLRGGAAINVLARHAGAKVIVVDMGVAADMKPHPSLINKKVGLGTKNFYKGPAMTKSEAIKSLEAGIEVVESINSEGKISVICTGDMGIGNTTASSAIAAVFTGKAVSDVTGRGTGINDEAFNMPMSL